MPIEIDRSSDPRVAAYTGLTDAELRRTLESDQGFFVVEGVLAVQRLLGTRWPIRSVLVRPEKAAEVAAVIRAAEAAGAPVYFASQDVFDQIAGFHIHRGVLALAGRLEETDPRRLLAAAGTALIVEGVNDHENLGALFRNAAALGAGTVLMDPSCCDPLYRRSIRVSVGHILRMPFARLSPWPDGLQTVLEAGYAVVALTPSGTSSIDDVADELSDPDLKVAVLVGAEGPGVSAGALAAATHLVRIPMARGVDSLNVATAAAIALHRLGRV